MALWTPDLLGTDLYSWYDASDATKVIVTGSGVSQWTDKSSYGRNAVQTDDTVRPVFSVNNIGFTGAQHLVLSGYPALYDFIAFAKIAGFVGYHVLLYGGNGIPLLTDSSDIPALGQYTVETGFAQAGTLTWPRDTYSFVYGSISNVANCAYAKDGGALFTTGQQITSSVIYNIGRGDYAGQAFGNLYELIFVTYGASTDTKQKLEGFLAWKWGFQGNLPADHPYKNAAPTIVASVANASALMIGV